VPAGLTGSGLSQTWVHIQVWKGIFQHDGASGHAMKLNYRTGTEGSPVSSLNCDRPLLSGISCNECWLLAAGYLLHRDHRCTDYAMTYGGRNSVAHHPSTDIKHTLGLAHWAVP